MLNLKVWVMVLLGLIGWPGQVLEPAALPERIAQTTAEGGCLALGGDFTLEAIEREHIQRVIARTPTLEDAANILGVDDSTLWRKRKKFVE